MFRVENADFIADKLAAELLPYQEFREAYKNSEEAVNRRIAETGATSGRVEFDVDWPLLAESGNWYIACADNGDGMGKGELSKYMTTLAVRGAGNSQGLRANQGMGLKISGPTRHKRGILIRSMKAGECWMLQVGWNGEQYGLIPIGDQDELVVPVQPEMFPQFIRTQGSGTVVTFLGNTDNDNTFSPPDRPRGWLFKYLNQRFYRLSEENRDVLVRVPVGEEDEWPRTLEEASDRQRGAGGRSFNLSRVKGTANIWDEAADRDPSGEHHGTVELPGNAAADAPAARLHWWVLPDGAGSDVTSRTSGGGSVAVLFQNELHDWRTSGQANPFFARLGVLYGKTRICFVLEPVGGTIASDFARAHVLVGGKPVFESDSWMVWSEQFRAQMPDAVKQLMAEEQARIQAEDPERARRIHDRLKDVLQLLRPRRFRRQVDGSMRASGPEVTGPGAGSGPISEHSGAGHRRSTGTRGIGAVLSQLDENQGDSASEVVSMLHLDPRWVTETEAEGFPIVTGNGKGLHDRAAAVAGEDGASASILLLNKEFRGYRTILAAVNDWANTEGDDTKSSIIEDSTREWIEQKMIEAISGLRQLENGSTWLPTNFDDALSPMALTAVFMADRYHTLREVRRQAGSLRQAASLPA